ncbi:unnamed protein product [Peniophora sp. CBMAI 1063]|nr:unnamed protein product [Peniophora sp. CBMAI 1063]
MQISTSLFVLMLPLLVIAFPVAAPAPVPAPAPIAAPDKRFLNEPDGSTQPGRRAHRAQIISFVRFD